MRPALLYFLLIVPATAHAQGPVRYQIESRIRAETASESIGRPETASVEFTTRAIVSVSRRDSAGGALFRVTVDSIHSDRFDFVRGMRDSLAPELRALITSGQGGTIDLAVRNGDRQRPLLVPAMNLELRQIMEILPLFFPERRGGSRTGSWIDSTGWPEPAARAGATSPPLVTTYRWSGDTLTGAVTRTLRANVLRPATETIETRGIFWIIPAPDQMPRTARLERRTLDRTADIVHPQGRPPEPLGRLTTEIIVVTRIGGAP